MENSNKIDWERIYHLISESEEWRRDDPGYADSCDAMLSEYVPLLIERIQEIAKWKNGWKKKCEALEKRLEHEKVMRFLANGHTGQSYHDIQPRNFSKPPFQITYEGIPYDPNIWSNSTLRDSI